eukprot:5736485-Pyramimonas_sp.AAC.1
MTSWAGLPLRAPMAATRLSLARMRSSGRFAPNIALTASLLKAPSPSEYIANAGPRCIALW